jgi:hypothetical protein
MDIYAGMDVSDKATHLCVVDGAGVVLRRDVVASDPELDTRNNRDFGDLIGRGAA